MAASKVFISYRREDTAWAARAVFERLRQVFAKDVFIDIETIGLGRKFAEVIDQHLEGCTVMLVMIGPQWEDSIEARAQSGEVDLVRTEVTRALAKTPPIPLVPVLVDRKRMPGRNRVPEDLRPVLEFNGVAIEAASFDAQMGQLIAAVGQVLKPDGSAPPVGFPAAAPPPAVPKAGPALEPWMSDRGKDGYGEWADLIVNSVVQRLRWIPPGEFWMGSTDAERKRFEAGSPYDDEKPRHRVRLGQGFWLADTACSQALWQTLVGDNPSKFTGDLSLPVEGVSWDDVTDRFLVSLNTRLQGAVAVLPTEAQWEYACRAGTETAFAFGESVTTDQVNFNGDHPGQAKGTDRQRTVPVKALLCNAWGLYQMHGNVWEWCADGRRVYATSASAVTDPQGPAEPSSSAPRAVRGGSWRDRARGARSAFRGALERGRRADYLGFRLALRSSSTSPSGGA